MQPIVEDAGVRVKLLALTIIKGFSMNQEPARQYWNRMEAAERFGGQIAMVGVHILDA
jgi:hypothetical protein